MTLRVQEVQDILGVNMADRKITEVIKQLLEVIPVELKHARESLDRVSYDSTFRAPEIMYESWADLRDVLRDMLDGKQPSKEWEIRMCEIMTTKTRRELGLG